MLTGDIFGFVFLLGLLCWALYLTRDDRKRSHKLECYQ